MLGLLVLLLGVIFGYGYLTNPIRVRGMAQAYLSKVVGGPVEVGSATLSIFQGLRLDDVKVTVDHASRPDSVLLTAQTFLLRYDLKAMLRGDLEAKQIIVINPRLYLSENLDTGQRNYQRLLHRSEAASRPFNERGHPIVLPEVLLRNAEVEYSEISHGKYHPLGMMRIDGQISPADRADQYHFEFQSRSDTEGIGPIAAGTISMGSGAVEAKLSNFQFNQALLNVLPSVVRQWGQDHQLRGSVDVPIVRYTPGPHGEPARFRVEASLKGVSLTVHPREWMGRDEIAHRQSLARTQEVMRRSGLNLGRAADLQSDLLAVSPVTLDQVTGQFVFTPEGIDIKGLRGQLDSNVLQIEGRINGYSPESPMTVRLSSLKDENLFLPPAPRYISALPGDLRELYEHLRPQGSCRIWAQAQRLEPGAAVRVRGEVDVLDGQFVFDLFPYPLRQARGKITFGPDPTTGADRCDIINLRGLGAPGGPNENANVIINASVMPLGGDAEVKVRVQSDHVYSEPRLIQAMPAEVKQTLHMFAGAGSSETYPSFNGSFVCDVHRPPGPHQKWLTSVDLQIADSHGAFSLFPYPLEHVRGHLHIGDHFVDIDKMTMHDGKTSLVVDGRVSFEKNQPLRPELTITARNVPMDKTFINAIPGDRQQWVRNAGLGGTIDIDGRVFRSSDSDPITYQLDVALQNGSVWPAGATYALGNVNAKLRLTPDTLTLLHFQGRRGDAELSGTGALTDMDHHPRLKLSAQATNLSMEPALYQLLPAGAKEAWDEVHPSGTLNAMLKCDVAIGGKSEGATTRPSDAGDAQPHKATSAPSAASRNANTETRNSSFDLTLRPVKLSMTPQVVPYRLDDLRGAIHITDKGVVLENMTARHGAAQITLSGTGAVGGKTARPDGGGTWDLRLALADAPIDADLKTALPEALRDLFEAMKLHGTLSMRFDKLLYRAVKEPDIDFGGRLWLKDADLEAGVQLDHVEGAIDLNGNVRQGRLGDLRGQMNFPSLTMADRPVENLRGELLKSAGREALRIAHLQAAVAGGEMGGQIDLSFPQQGPSQYTLGIVLRNADLQTLTGDGGHDVRGQLSASLSLEGNWSDPTSRRGRGDVTASGKRMYRIPLLLGLMQITNLSLPAGQPFNEASARYSVEGNHVTFEQIELRSDSMAMQGNGQLDFGTKKVHLSFVVDNPNGLKLPFLTDLFNGFKQELFQIHINGSITQPASASAAAGTYQTTVDKVYRGGDEGK
jgi:hypothetical protein